jgi:hypothetical protein
MVSHGPEGIVIMLGRRGFLLSHEITMRGCVCHTRVAMHRQHVETAAGVGAAMSSEDQSEDENAVQGIPLIQSTLGCPVCPREFRAAVSTH